jgi:NAD(P)-dependent dehydrogenase (short-subunit alcohol dehydrogenase family)
MKTESFAGNLRRPRQTVRPRVDILVNNLGIFGVSFEDIPDEEIWRFFEVNVLSGGR